ncbi:hypothetical protein EDB19DRAFT_1832685 [Suillus lakei]|nr:hypothetical protein EDB19DRAFT_1832685 [Suillus lakei]
MSDLGPDSPSLSPSLINKDQCPAMPPPYSLQGMLPNPDGVVHPDTAPLTQQPYHDVNMTECGRVSRVRIRFPVDIPFGDFFSHICAQMDLDPVNAELGYKFHNDQVRDAPHQLSNKQQLWEAFEQGCTLIK